METGRTDRVDNPRSTVPGRCVNGSPEVKEENGSNATTIQVVARMLCRLYHVDVRTGDPHADRTGDTTSLVGLVNGCNFFGDIDIRGFHLTDPAKVLHGLLAAILEEEPTG